MSTADYATSPAYCEIGDVAEAMQETSEQMSATPLGDANVETAIYAASRWVKEKTGMHFYDSSGDGNQDLVGTTAETTTNRLLDVPDSPHRQDGQLFRAADRTRTQTTYPNTQVGSYVKVRLPKRHVESIDKMEVREYGGDVTDWVASSEYQESKGEDYYLRVEGGTKGRSYLYVHAGSLGPHKDFNDLIEVDLTYGLDWQDTEWADVRRGVAHLAAAELVVDDDVLTALPENVQLANVETEAQIHLDTAMDRYLSRYMRAAVE